jgi:hypothetical protein
MDSYNMCIDSAMRVFKDSSNDLMAAGMALAVAQMNATLKSPEGRRTSGSPADE